MKMPVAEQDILAQREQLLKEFRNFLPSERVIADVASLRAYDCDALTAYRQMPMVVVLPDDVIEVSKILTICNRRNIKVVARGAGTSVSGGALPLEDSVLLSMGRFNRIIDIDYDNRCLTAQSGVTNLALSEAVAGRNFYYAPDPSSQIACTIGGNVAENSGGVHCLKYGMTTNNLLGIEVVLMDGSVIRLGGKHQDAEGYDLLGLLTGSEGLLGVITEVCVRILPTPENARAVLIGFNNNESAGQMVGNIIAAGIIPAGLEMMDKFIVQATEDFCHAGYPLDAEALLIVELDGPSVEVDYLVDRIVAIADQTGATSLKVSTSEEERLTFWLGRKSAFPAVGRLSPDYFCMDGTIPRHQLPHVLTRMAEMSREYELRVTNVFHAGDGNLHPLIMYDANQPGELERAEEF
ncbi:MAG: FAD-binding oxidoreductase, partial [Gammaproteobacteria bacterium]